MKTAPANPTPNTMPTLRADAITPEAIPWRFRGAEPNNALVFGEMKVPVPKPVIPNASKICGRNVLNAGMTENE